MHVFDRDLLLPAFAALAIECSQQLCESAGRTGCSFAETLCCLRRLIRNHRSPATFHRRVMHGDGLGREHCFDLIRWA